MFEAKRIIVGVDALNIEGLPKVEKLNPLVGSYVNLEYELPNGSKVRFLKDDATYLGNQLECGSDGSGYFGVLSDTDFILICTYGKNSADPELIMYKKDNVIVQRSGMTYQAYRFLHLTLCFLQLTLRTVDNFQKD